MKKIQIPTEVNRLEASELGGYSAYKLEGFGYIIVDDRTNYVENILLADEEDMLLFSDNNWFWYDYLTGVANVLKIGLCDLRYECARQGIIAKLKYIIDLEEYRLFTDDATFKRLKEL